MTLDGVTYFYLLDATGEIMGLLDEEGNRAVEYICEGYGKSMYYNTSPTAYSLGHIDPLCYRGYVFDYGTGLYYLQSRSYNYTTGRFINADGLVSTGQGLTSNNMFAYCGNNPINFCDPTGKSGIGALIIIGLCALLLSGCASKEPIVVSDSGPYNSADDAARGFGQEVYSSSVYIRHEYSTTIYSQEIDGVTTYNYTPPRAGNPHSVAIGDPAPEGGTTVAYAHIHPNSNGFSDIDKQVAINKDLNIYLITPKSKLKMYNPGKNLTINLGYISSTPLTAEQMECLVSEFSMSWDTHLADCNNCSGIAWPTP